MSMRARVLQFFCGPMKRRIVATIVLVVVAGLATASKANASYAPGCTVALNVGGAVAHEAHAAAIQADGKIVVAGYADLGSGKDFLVARLHPDLSLDTSFNGTGYRVDDIQGRADEAFAVVVQFDQKILVGGYSQQNPGKFYFAFVRYNRDGSLDSTFGPGGISLIDFVGSSNDRLQGMTIQPDGKILGVGFGTPSGQRVAVVRLLKNGALDSSFGSAGGFVPTIPGSSVSFGTDVVVQPDGKILVFGEARFGTSDFLVVRLLPNGSLDTTFNASGWVATDIGTASTDSASALALQLDGKIVVAGTSNGNAAVARYTPGGSLDGTFGGTGKVVHDFGATDSGNGLALDAAGNLLVGGGASVPPSNFAFARFRPNGVLDLTKTDDISGLDDRIFDIAVTRQGKLLVAGSTQGATNWKSTLALYLPDGSQDCGPPVNPVDVFTAGASGDSVNGQVMLNWLNPSYGPYNRTVIRRDTIACPATVADGVQVASISGAPGAPDGFVDTVPLGPTYFYTAFVLDSVSTASTGVCKTATPFDRAAAKVDWIYDTSISALATPGLRLNVPLGESVVYTVANDGLVHAIRGGRAVTGAGQWPAGWKPFRIGGAAQARPPIVPLPPGSKLAVMLGSQDGNVYAIDALNGDLIWKSAKLAMTLQAAPAVVLSAFGGGANLVFVGTREAAQPNRLYALNADDGTVAWAFDNGGGPNAIGMVVGNASVDYATKRLYFTSARGASGKTTWCLDYTVSPPAKCSGWSTFGVDPAVGADVQASPILYQGSLFVSDSGLGDLYAVNPLDGSSVLFFPLGTGGANGFVFPQFGTSNVFASTSLESMSVSFGSLNWTTGPACVATPSTPIAVPGSDWIFVGSNEGKLFQFSASGGTSCPSPLSACVGDCVSTIVGAPTYDILKTMLYVGTDDGKVYGVRPPF
jgi:uncharacterized delta-60 repeat protein